MEPNILLGLAGNKELLEATKIFILKYFEDTPFSEGASDELLGQVFRARHVGRLKVEEAFKKIESLKLIPKSETQDNPAY